MGVEEFYEDLGKISIKDYAESIIVLLDVSRMEGTSGGKAASLFLLSLYNGMKWKIDLTLLTCLDSKYKYAATTALLGRIKFRKEPQQLIKNGSDVFCELWNRWEHCLDN